MEVTTESIRQEGLITRRISSFDVDKFLQSMGPIKSQMFYNSVEQIGNDIREEVQTLEGKCLLLPAALL